MAHQNMKVFHCCSIVPTIVEGGESLSIIDVGRRDGCNHNRLTITTQALLQEKGQHRVAIGHMLLLVWVCIYVCVIVCVCGCVCICVMCVCVCTYVKGACVL